MATVNGWANVKSHYAKGNRGQPSVKTTAFGMIMKENNYITDR